MKRANASNALPGEYPMSQTRESKFEVGGSSDVPGAMHKKKKINLLWYHWGLASHSGCPTRNDTLLLLD